jgi:hypothetical protein
MLYRMAITLDYWLGQTYRIGKSYGTCTLLNLRDTRFSMHVETESLE